MGQFIAIFLIAGRRIHIKYLRDAMRHGNKGAAPRPPF
jgi:hypothetical protein